MNEDNQETVNGETKCSEPGCDFTEDHGHPSLEEVGVESRTVLCFEAQHLAPTSHFLYSQMVNEKFCSFYVCARCGVVFAPDAILGEGVK